MPKKSRPVEGAAFCSLGFHFRQSGFYIRRLGAS